MSLVLPSEILAKMPLRHRLLTALISGCELRVTQAISLRFSDFDFEHRLLKVEGKRPRTIFLENEVYETLRQYTAEAQPQDLAQYLFPSPTNTGKHIDRRSVNYALQRFAENQGLEHITPRTLKNIAQAPETPETPTTQAKTSKFTLRALVASHKAQANPIPLNLQQAQNLPTDLHIGRQDQINHANSILMRGINLVITGEAGVGKNRFLDCLQYPLPTIVLDDTKDFKKSLANAIVFLLGGDEEEARLRLNCTGEELMTKVNKESMVNLADLLCDLVPKKSHILRISDVSDVTPLVIRVLKERLVEHFIIATTARELRKDRSDYLWNFERIELKNLPRAQSIQLAYQLSETLPIEDFTYFKNKIHQTTQGNPRMIAQICDRISREFGLIQNHIVESICNSYLGKRVREIDMSFFFLALCLIVFAIVWFRTGAERELLRFARFGIVILLVFGRAFFRNFKRKII